MRPPRARASPRRPSRQPPPHERRALPVAPPGDSSSASWSAGGILMMIPFLWMITTSLKTRAEVFAARRRSCLGSPNGQNYPDMWNALPFGDVLRELGQDRDAEHDRPADQLLDGRVRLRRPPLPVPGAAVRAAPGDADHPVPGRARPELHPVPASCPTRPAPAATGSGPRSRCGSGRSSAARSGRSCSASSSWRSRTSWPMRPGSTERTRGTSIATSTCRWPSPPWPPWRSSRSCGPGTT